MTTNRQSVRSAGPSRAGWLEEAVAELKADDPQRPVSIIVSNYVVGRFVRRHIGRTGGSVNVRTLRLVELAAAVAAPRHDARETLDP